MRPLRALATLVGVASLGVALFALVAPGRLAPFIPVELYEQLGRSEFLRLLGGAVLLYGGWVGLRSGSGLMNASPQLPTLEPTDSITRLPSVDASRATRLRDAGYGTVGSLAAADVEELRDVNGIGQTIGAILTSEARDALESGPERANRNWADESKTASTDAEGSNAAQPDGPSDATAAANDTSGIQSVDPAAFRKLQDHPPEQPAAVNPICGGDIDEAIRAAIATAETASVIEARESLRSTLRPVVLAVETHRRGGDRADAEAAIKRGEWTDDALVAAITSADETVRVPVAERFLGWLRPDAHLERCAERTLAELEAVMTMAAESEDGGEGEEKAEEMVSP